MVGSWLNSLVVDEI